MPPLLTYPDYLQTVTDPTFGTPFTQVTDPGQEMLPGIPCELTRCTHRYSSSQVWNADQSLLLIVNGCSGLCSWTGELPFRSFTMPLPTNASGIRWIQL